MPPITQMTSAFGAKVMHGTVRETVVLQAWKTETGGHAMMAASFSTSANRRQDLLLLSSAVPYLGW